MYNPNGRGSGTHTNGRDVRNIVPSFTALDERREIRHPVGGLPWQMVRLKTRTLAPMEVRPSCPLRKKPLALLFPVS